MTTKISSLILWLVVLAGGVARAELDVEAGMQLRYFPALEPAWDESALLLNLQAHPYARDGDLRHALDLSADLRVSREHSHAELREMIYTVSSRSFELRFGQGREFWGVTEAVHLVDVINQDDWLSSLDGDDKLGQPLLSLAWSGDYGLFKGWWLPRFRQRRFPASLRQVAPFAIDDRASVFESALGEQHGDRALRWSHYVGALDIALSYFAGTAREPRLRPCARRGSGRPGTENGPQCDLQQAFAPPERSPLDDLLLQLSAGLGLGPDEETLEDEFIQAALADIDLIPHYDQLRQWGLELQWVIGGWALKFEGRHQRQRGEQALAFSSGFEYTTAAPFSWPADFGYLVEYLHDQRDPDQHLVVFNNDLLLGFRATVSDVAGSQLLGGMIVDLDGRGLAGSLEASRRLGEHWKLALEARVFAALPADDNAALLDDLDQLQLNLTRYF